MRGPILFAVIAMALLAVGFLQSWSLSLTILNLCLISSIMALGLNMQWGYAGLFNVGVMAFAALGGVAAVLVSQPPVPAAWAAGGSDLLFALLILAFSIAVIVLVRRRMKKGALRAAATFMLALVAYGMTRVFFDPAVEAIEAVDPSSTGYLGGLGLPILLAWPIGGVIAAGAAWLVGKVALGLRADYLAIATLGISEIVLAMLKHEDWLTRGVKNVTGLDRPTPYEVELQASVWFVDWSGRLGVSPVEASSVSVKLSYTALFLVVLAALMWLAERALHSPWGRMMHAIRDNETAAEAMGKDVTRRHLQIFVIGAAVVGIAGAMLTTLDGQFMPGTYNPLRYTFLIWVMVIVGGSGNNWGAVLGGFVIWLVWVEAEPVGLWLMGLVTSGLTEDSALRLHLIEGAAHMRLFVMGLLLLLVLRFSPRGLLPADPRC